MTSFTDTAIRRYAPASRRPDVDCELPPRPRTTTELLVGGEWHTISDAPLSDLPFTRRLAEGTARQASTRKIALVRIVRHDAIDPEPETVCVFVGEQGIVREAEAIDSFTLDEFCRLMAGASAAALGNED
jgi:hypothetical protein